MNPPDEPTPEETHEVCQALPYQQKIHGITVHYTGEPTTTRWYTHGSKRHGRAGGGIYNGTYRAAFRVHGPQQVYRAETIACAFASELASEQKQVYDHVVKLHCDASAKLTAKFRDIPFRKGDRVGVRDLPRKDQPNFNELKHI